MTKRQENTLTMWAAVHTVLLREEQVWRPLEAFSKAADLFFRLQQALIPVVGLQLSGTHGITLDKKAVRSQLEEASVQLAANLEAFALTTGNNALKEEVHFTASSFSVMRDNILPVTVQKLLDKGAMYFNELTAYGVAEESLKELQQLLNHYLDYSAAPRVAIGKRKTARTDIAAQIEEGNNALEIMDKLAGNFNNTAPGFVAAFRSARMIVDVGVHKQRKAKPEEPKG